MNSGKQKAEKITVTIPYELKEQLMQLKDELQTSVSSIYKDALENYMKQKEIEKWHKGALKASQDKDYISFVSELNEDDGDIYEY